MFSKLRHKTTRHVILNSHNESRGQIKSLGENMDDWERFTNLVTFEASQVQSTSTLQEKKFLGSLETFAGEHVHGAADLRLQERILRRWWRGGVLGNLIW